MLNELKKAIPLQILVWIIVLPIGLGTFVWQGDGTGVAIVLVSSLSPLISTGIAYYVKRKIHNSPVQVKFGQEEALCTSHDETPTEV